jgi:hypothetical protein
MVRMTVKEVLLIQHPLKERGKGRVILKGFGKPHGNPGRDKPAENNLPLPFTS